MGVEHYENFPVASWLCPPAIRPAVQAIYWFARTADDLVDEGHAAVPERLQALNLYRADLRSVAQGRSPSERWPEVFEPLAAAMRRHALPLPLFEALLSAFEQDLTKNRYADRDELLDYCRRSANPVGRLMLHLFGVRDDLSLTQSDAICTSLQLINFWQDLSVDIERDRLYVPLADCQREAVTPSRLLERQHDRAVRRLIAGLVQWARQLMQDGAPLARRLPGRVGWELRLVVQGGLRILDKIEHIEHRTLERRPVLRRGDVPALLWSAWRM